MTSSNSGANGQSVQSTHSASSGGPASEPRLPACATRPLIGPMARGLAATSGTDAKVAAGTRPPIAKDSAKPTTAMGSGSTVKQSAASAIEPSSPIAASRPGETPARISQPARRLPGMPKAVAMAAMRPASAAARPRRSTSQAGSNPATARKSRAKQKKAAASGREAASAPGRRLLVAARGAADRAARRRP